jgi:hypothetical protein
MNVKKMLARIAEMIDNTFLIPPPAFYAVISGAFIGVATNLFTILISIQCEFISYFIKLAIFSYIVSSGSFLYIFIVSERLQGSYRGTDLEDEIKGWRKHLWISAFVGCLSFGMSIYFLALII